jgi:hypothetical protein
MSLVIKNLVLRGQLNRKLLDRKLKPFTVEEQIGKHIYILKLQAGVRLHPTFHVNNIRPYSTPFLRHAVLVTTPKGDDDEFEVSHIFVVCIKSLPGRRGKYYLLFITHFNDDDIPHVLYRLNEVHCEKYNSAIVYCMTLHMYSLLI